MGKPDNIFLTDTRKEYLNNPESFSEDAQHAHFYRVRDRAQMALEELIEVYQSDVIDNSELFEPSDVHRLFDALLGDPTEITPRNKYDGEYTEWAKEYRYEDALLAEIENLSMRWRVYLLGTPVEAPQGHMEYLEYLQSVFEESDEVPKTALEDS
jgi:hypothetical protein